VHSTSSTTFRELDAAELAALAAQLQQEKLPHENLAAAARHYFCLAGDDQRVLGYSGLEHFGDTALLRSVVVPAAARGKGHGHDLVMRTLDAARQLGVRRVFLLTTSAARFFGALGFRSVARDEAPASIRTSEEFALQCPVTAVLMERDVL
jgi:N-acetylglutamate synthase-like GNAT family acetyltransferase